MPDPGPPPVGRLAHGYGRLRDALHVAVRELVKFGAVGGLAFVVDVGLFNLLRFSGSGPLADRPLTAKAVSVVVATVVAYLGNRYWTFRRRQHGSPRREFVLFVAMNVAGLLIALGCLAFSHYLLGLRSPLADNISANGVGLVLGTTFRFWAYRRFVFPELRAEIPSPGRGDPVTPPGPQAAAADRPADR